MGEAKRRGSFAKRKTEAVERNRQIEKERYRKIAEERAKETPKQRMDRAKYRATLAILGAGPLLGNPIRRKPH